MLISCDCDMLLISWATRAEMGAVEVTQGHDVGRPADPAPGGAAAAGTAPSTDSATAAAAVTSWRFRLLPQARTTRLTNPLTITHLQCAQHRDSDTVKGILRAIVRICQDH